MIIRKIHFKVNSLHICILCIASNLKLLLIVSLLKWAMYLHAILQGSLTLLHCLQLLKHATKKQPPRNVEINIEVSKVAVHLMAARHWHQDSE